MFFDPYASDDQGRYASRHTYISFQKYKWAHFPGRKYFSFFLRAPYILRTTDFSSNNGGQRRQGLKPYLSEKVKMACRIIIHGAQGLAVGVLTPIPLRLGLGWNESVGPVHQKTTRGPANLFGVPRKGQDRFGDQARSWSVRIGILIRPHMAIVTG